MSYVFNQNIEQFKTIQDYPDYEIGDHGTVRSMKFGKVRVMKPVVNNNGYLYVGLRKDGKQNGHLIHRLVTMAFIPNPENKPEVNHLDGDKKDNRVCSLEWVTKE